MSLFHIVLKNLRQHALSTGITSLSVALAGGLLMSVWVVKSQSRQVFEQVDGGFDAVLGTRASKLQLVLNAVYHLEASPGNLKWEDYLEVRDRPGVSEAVPIAMGDNYRGYRVVGTLTNLFAAAEFESGKSFQLDSGRIFNPGFREAVAGSFVAQRLGLRVGSHFHPYHGVQFDEEHQHDDEYVVVGVLEPSNSPMDRVLWIPVEGVQNMSGHDPASAGDISAVLVKLGGGSGAMGFRLDQQYNQQGDRLTFAWPIGTIVARLFDKIGWFDRVLAVVAYLVALVAVGSVLASVYNTMNERRRDFAILRALGAGRSTLLWIVVLESAVIGVAGMLLAMAIHFGILQLAAQVIRAQTGVVLTTFAWHPVLLAAPVAMIAACALSGLVPALKAYRTPVADNLVPAA